MAPPARAARRRRDPDATARATSPSGRTASTRSAATARSSRRRAARWATALPAAVAAKLVHPERTVVCFAGDGDFLMSGARARDRRAVRGARRRPRRRQRDVRDDPHAPGAPLPWARERHRPREPGLRRARRGVRLPRRARRAHRRRSRPRSTVRSPPDVPAVLHLRVDPERDHPARDDRRDPLCGATGGCPMTAARRRAVRRGTPAEPPDRLDHPNPQEERWHVRTRAR